MFLTDSQTMSDLSIFTKGNSVFEWYNQTRTSGGAEVLEAFFRYPLDNVAAIASSLELINVFGAANRPFPFDRVWLDTIEGYLSERDQRSGLLPSSQGLKQKVAGWVAGDTTYQNIQKAVSRLIDLLWTLDEFMKSGAHQESKAFKGWREDSMLLLHNGAFDAVFKQDRTVKLTGDSYAALDQLFRFRAYNQVKKILRRVYEMDVYYSIALLAREKQLSFAHPLAPGGQSAGFAAAGLRHPLIENARGNDLYMDQRQNLFFLTGANMAGKSTLMKSIGLAVYLAHLGMPVAAASVEFTVMEGLYSTINLPDNLGMGASHFYAEVLRVKKVAKELAAKKSLFVLFDELFRGTNVKDAAEATVAVLEGFTRQNKSLFVVSTHIMEAAAALSQRTDRILYSYLPTAIENGRPVYTYALRKGVTEDRHGMIIINNEGILPMLAAGLQHRSS